MAAALVEVIPRQDVVQDDQAPQLFHGPAGEERREPYQAVGGGPGLLKFLELCEVVSGGVTIAVKGKIHDDPPRVALRIKTLQGQFADIPKQQLTGTLRAAPQGIITQQELPALLWSKAQLFIEQASGLVNAIAIIVDVLGVGQNAVGVDT